MYDKKYSSEDIFNMTWHEWNTTMAKELNKAGFLGYGFNPSTHKFEKNQAPYCADPNSPSSFILGAVDTAPEIDYLKKIGLLNNHRCPMCGRRIHGDPGRFTSGFDYNVHFQICQECVSHGNKKSFSYSILGIIMCIILLPIQLLLLPIKLVLLLFKRS